MSLMQSWRKALGECLVKMGNSLIGEQQCQVREISCMIDYEYDGDNILDAFTLNGLNLHGYSEEMQKFMRSEIRDVIKERLSRYRTHYDFTGKRENAQLSLDDYLNVDPFCENYEEVRSAFLVLNYKYRDSDISLSHFEVYLYQVGTALVITDKQSHHIGNDQGYQFCERSGGYSDRCYDLNFNPISRADFEHRLKEELTRVRLEQALVDNAL